ncbi:Ig-like domain-containing protein [Paenibacillus sp. GCM10027627]|uniref:Ig-like domain-containing protein n=1 Tax=unclassified Paenibacillus TaxID=185978 RepID=UPI003635CF15
MYRIRKLSLILAILMIVQVGFPFGSNTLPVTAAPAGPVALGFYPADNLTNVPLGANLKITFDENVRLGHSSANIVIYRSSDNQPIETLNIGSGRVSVSSDQREVIIDPILSSTGYKFELNTDYYVLVDSGAILNVSNNAPYGGIQNATFWNFRTVATEDSTKPTHTGRSPEGGTHPVTSQLSISFSEPVYAAGGQIVLASNDDTRYIPVTSSGVRGSGTPQITVIPDGALLPNTTYTVSIGYDNFQDASGNAFDPISWSFITASAPVNLSGSNPFYPADNSTLVPVGDNLVITFDQPVQANSGKMIEIRRVSDNVIVQTIDAASSAVQLSGQSATINPPSDLAANTAYYVLIQAGAFSKPNPNSSQWFYGISAATIWNFTTGYGYDTTPPSVLEYAPARYGVAPGTNTNLVLKFNEEVFPSSGNIEIRQSIGGALFRSIPITSSRVAGGGTKQLIIDATSYINSVDTSKPFLNNTKYYVTIGNRALRDGAGNFFAGISGTGGWEFTITSDGARPTLSGLTPPNGSNAVDVNGTFTATFNKPIVKGTDPSKGITFYPTTSGSAAIPAQYYVDTANNSRILIQPASPLAANTNYYINIAEGAVTDLIGNAFIGILNQYQWTFLTKGGDTAAPTVSKSEVSGSIIKLIYNEPLNPDLKPSPASYYVTVAGAPRNVTDVKIEGNMVLLTLANFVSYNQKVELSYTKPAVGLVQDVSGNQAASLSKVDIANGLSTKAPVVTSGTVYGNTVVLNFSEALMSPSPYSYTQFNVNVSGSNYSTSAIWHSGNVIQLTLSGSVPSGGVVLVSYSSGTYPIYGVSGNAVASFSNYNPATGSGGGTGGPDVTAPSLQSITAVGTLVTLKYNELLNASSVPGSFQYSVLADGQVRPVTNVVIAGDSIFLSVSGSFAAGQTITVSYIGGNTVRDNSGNAALSFTNVTANTGGNGGGTGGTATMQGAILKGSKLTINFSGALDMSSVPAPSLFLVRVKETVRVVSSVQISGSTVVLTLSAPANTGEKAEISYFTNANGLKSANGQAVATFSNMNVANQTTLLDSLTGDYEAADGGNGVAIKSSGATMSSDTSPAGVSANRYTVMNDRFMTAVTTSRNAGLTSPRIVFKVPDHERAAIVAISVITLEMASKQGGDVVFAVQHGNATYELPLKALNFAELASAVGGNGISNQVLIAIDQGASSKTSALSAALNNSKAAVIAGPIHYEVQVVNGSAKQELNNFAGYISRTIKTATALNTSQTSVVWLDPVTGLLTYVPTTFKNEGGSTVATFKRKGNSAYALVRNTSSFNDLGKHWASDTVHMMARKFIVEGHTVSKFEPNKPITRGEFATYIAKGLGLTGNRAAAAKFKDVNSNTAMGAYIGAAASAGIVNGVDASNFKPNSYITRQDMASMMMRAAKTAGMTVNLPNSADSYLQSFSDRKKVSSYAKTSVAQAIHLGIITGKTTTTLSPTTNATRAEGTVMLMRLLQKANFLTP